MLPSSRLLVSGTLAAGIIALPAGLAGPAAADLTVPSPLPTVSAPADVPTLPEPVASTVTALTGGGSPSTTPDAGSSPDNGSGLPTALPTAVPPLPAAPGGPSLPGGGGDTGRSPAPAKRSTSSTGTATSNGPLGDDVLPAALEDELCAVLEQVMTPMPKEIRGLPAAVIAQLPAQLTDQVPDDVLRVVTLRCAATAPAPSPQSADRRAADRTPVLSRHSARRAAPHRTAPAARSYSSLPHTGLLAGIPLTGVGLVLAGLAVRRRGQSSTPRR